MMFTLYCFAFIGFMTLTVLVVICIEEIGQRLGKWFAEVEKYRNAVALENKIVEQDKTISELKAELATASNGPFRSSGKGSNYDHC